MPGKKMNNDKNYSAHTAWMKRKKEGRLKQMWNAIFGWVKLGADAKRNELEQASQFLPS